MNKFLSGFLLVILLSVNSNAELGPKGNRVVSDYQSLPFSSDRHGQKCEPIKIPLCLNYILYNETIYPNLLNHQRQEEAGMAVTQFEPLVKVKCSPDLRMFLCSVYAPVCTIMLKPLPPCREMCESARNGCENLMNKFGFQWPPILDCAQYPYHQQDKMCVGENKTNKATPVPTARPNSISPQTYYVCPHLLQISSKKSDEYHLRVGNASIKQCSFPCAPDETLVSCNKYSHELCLYW